MSDNGNDPAVPDGPLVSGHLVVYRLETGEGLLCFRPDGGGDDSIVRRPLLGMMVQPLVMLLSGGEPEIDMNGANGRVMHRIARVMGLG